MLLKGRCRYCNTQLPLSLLFSELFGGILFALFYLRFEFSIFFAYAAVCSIVLGLLALEDIKTRQVSDSRQLFLALLFLFGSLFLGGASVSSRIIALFLFGGMTFLLNRFFPESLGDGDVIFIALAAYGTGIYYFSHLFLVGLSMALVSVVIKGLYSGNIRNQSVPLIAYLTIGIWLGWLLWPESLIG